MASATKELAIPTVREQMDALAGKAKRLKSKDPLLGRAVISRLLENLKKTAEGGSSKLEETGVSATWLENVNAAILKANDVLNECEYHVRRHEALEPKNKERGYFSTMRKPRLSSGGLKSIISDLKKALKTSQGAAAHEEEMKYSSKLEVGDQPSPGEADQGTPNGARAAADEAIRGLSKFESEVVGEEMQTVVDELLNPGSLKLKSAIGDQPDQGPPNGSFAAAREAVKDSDSDKSSDLSVIFLVGRGETGKTALARLVYKNFDVMCYFDERVWVQVPGVGDLDTKTIGKCMLENLSGVGAGSLSPEDVTYQLKKRLHGKRFLLVLAGASDTNSTSKFVVLKKFLEGLGGFRGSAVLVTTGKSRNIKPSFAHHMKLDTSNYCLTLFNKIAFAEGGPIRSTPVMKETGKAIVKLCAGNSLFIKLVGNLMHGFKDEGQWSRILDELNKVGRKGIPQLCFDYMSSLPLKRCFQYCYFFPKGFLLRREDLVELWMAQGYLDLPNTSTPDDMEDRGRDYYEILMRSSFFQVSEDDDFDMRSCKIPDVLRDLKLLEEDSTLCFKTIEKGNAGDCAEAVHLTLIGCEVKYPVSLNMSRFSKLRSLRLEKTKGLKHLLGSAKGLRVLIIVDESLEELPDSIGKLTRLRYLDISRTRIVRLPDSISGLYSLQTLRLYDLQYHKLPKNFEKLLVNMTRLHIQKLENLYDMYDLLSKCGEFVLSSGKASLKVFVGKHRTIDSTKLHMLSDRCPAISIHCLENASNDESGITKWLKEIPAGTESLKLNWSTRGESRIDEDVLKYLIPNKSLKHLALENFKGITFPSWMMESSSTCISTLVKVDLENCSLCTELPPLGHLSCLRVLNILGMEGVKTISAEFYGGGTTVFGKLKEFTLCGMSKLEEWSEPTTSSTKAFPYLERFEVDQCPILTAIPDIVLAGEPKSFHKFKVSHCKKLASLPQGFGKIKYLEDLELFGLPALGHVSVDNATNLKSLIIGCVSATEEEKLLKELVKLTCLTDLTIWGYNKEDAPDCLGKMNSLQVLKFESCRLLKNLPAEITSSLKELHISYCPLLEESCIRGGRPEWPKVSHIETIHVNSEKIREPPATKKMPQS